jgi:hypothetical protein
MNMERLTSALVADYVKRMTSRDISMHFDAGANVPFDGTRLEQIYESYKKSRSSIDSDPVSGVTSTLVFEYLWRSGFKTVALELENIWGSEVNVNILQGLKIEDLQQHFTDRRIRKNSWKIGSRSAIVKNSYLLEKSYLDLVPVSEAFDEFIQRWNSTHSELDKAVEYILEKNPLIRCISLQVSLSSLRGMNEKTLNKFPELKIGSFTTFKGGEKDLIDDQWHCLNEGANLFEDTFKEELSLYLKIRRGSISYEYKWKALVIGTFLGGKLTKIRHAQDVVECFMRKLILSGKFSVEEDATMMDYVKAHGFTNETLKVLAVKFNRNVTTIRTHYNRISNKGNTGAWSLNEETAMVDALFPNITTKNIAYIKLVKVCQINEAGILQIIQRPIQAIYHHWVTVLCPILIRFHCGLLYQPWRPQVLQYIIDNQIQSNQDIDLEEIEQIAPGISLGCIGQLMTQIALKTDLQKMPFYLIAKSRIERYINPIRARSSSTDKKIEAIISHYSKGLDPLPMQIPH